MAGKSTVTKLLSTVLKSTSGKAVRKFTIDPNLHGPSKFFGSSSGTGPQKILEEGFWPGLLRSIILPAGDKHRGTHTNFIVFDAEIESWWGEQVGPHLETLYLPQLKKDLQMDARKSVEGPEFNHYSAADKDLYYIFESDKVDNCSPGLLARSYIVYLHPEAVTVDSQFKGLVRTLLDEEGAMQYGIKENSLQSIFTNLIYPLITLLDRKGIHDQFFNKRRNMITFHNLCLRFVKLLLARIQCQIQKLPITTKRQGNVGEYFDISRETLERIMFTSFVLSFGSSLSENDKAWFTKSLFDFKKLGIESKIESELNSKNPFDLYFDVETGKLASWHSEINVHPPDSMVDDVEGT